MRRTSQKSGFTLAETIIAIAVISLVVTASAQLTQSSVRIGYQSMHQFIAYHLAEEGLEIVRNMRDTNWLQNMPFRQGLPDGLYVIEDNADGSGARWRLQIISSMGDAPESSLNENEKFKRAIEISTLPDGPAMRVTSRVEYTAAGKKKEVGIAADFTDWKKGPL